MPYLQLLIWLVHMTGMQKTLVQTLTEPQCPLFSMVLNFLLAIHMLAYTFPMYK